MKVQCDVCEKAQATVLCCADEAALCAECDTRIHAANKLASKHQRVPLLYPPPEDLPCCDICQEKSGYFFCLEDRALLCRNCDYSIHSRNALAAKHKRFLVSGIRVALQVITANDTSECTQVCSPFQISSTGTQASQLSSPTTPVSQLSSPRSVPAQKTSRMTPVPNSTMKATSVIPQETSSLFASVVRDESLSKAPALSSPKEQQQQPQHVLPRHVAPTGVLPSRIVNTSPASSPSLSFSQQIHFNAGRQVSDWGMHTNINMNSHDGSKGQMLSTKRGVGNGGGGGGGGGGGMRRSSISEYLTEGIPGWRVDELLNLPDMDAIYDPGTSRTDAAIFRDMDGGPAECIACDVEGLGEAVAAEVPSIPSPPTASGVLRSIKPWGFGKSLKELDLNFLLQCDNTLVVPDIGGVSSPPTLSPSSLPQKRRRIFLEY